MKIDSGERREWVMLVLILAVAAAVRFYRIGAQSFWIDEILSLDASVASGGASFWERLLYNVHGPLHAVIIHLLRSVSVSEGVLRAPSAVAGTLSVLLLYRWLVMLGRRDIALYGALFFALSPFNLYYSQELRFYALMVMFALITLMAYERFLENPSYRNGALLGLASAAATLSHFSALFLAAGLFIHLIVTGRMKGRHLASGCIAVLVLLVLVSPWIYREIVYLRGIQVVQISELPEEERLRGDLTLNVWSYPYALYAFSAGYSFGPSLRELHGISSAVQLLGEHWLEMTVVGLLFGWLTAVGLWQARKRGTLSLFLSVLLAALAMTTVVAAFNIKVFNIRYMMASFPIYIALIAYGLPSGGTSRILLVSAVCAVMIVSSWNYLMNPRYERDDIKDAVSVIRKEERSGDILLAINSRAVIEHYYRGANKVLELNPRQLGGDETGIRAERALSENGRIWYIRCRHWDTDPDDLLLSSLEASASMTGRWRFPGVELYLFTSMREEVFAGSRRSGGTREGGGGG